MSEPIETPVDSPAAHALLEAYFAERAAGFPSDQGEYRTTFPDPTQFVPPQGVFLLLEDAELGPVGCGGVRRIADGLDDEGGSEVRYEVKHLFLAPIARGRGLGGAVLDELMRRAQTFGADLIVLDTNASLESAGALYRKRGFVPVEPYNDNPNATNWYAKRV
ncbi:GNAT family N-acetyltransferase [Microbacteriaceae bacterium VKM Ac-2855]|nr:GNAT family N-acetyltransferase [Microbacteriaceae bacterium VKM Ac-2855]